MLGRTDQEVAPGDLPGHREVRRERECRGLRGPGGEHDQVGPRAGQPGHRAPVPFHRGAGPPALGMDGGRIAGPVKARQHGVARGRPQRRAGVEVQVGPGLRHDAQKA